MTGRHHGGDVAMYKAEEQSVAMEDGVKILYGISDENRFYCEFTDSRETAENVAKLLNDNEVEGCHVSEIIEDLFYSG